MESKGHWHYDKPLDPTEHFGFVYLVTNLTTGRMYIGKKQFKYHLKKKVKGRKNRKHVKINSGWQNYTGSNKKLTKDIKDQGIKTFSFKIISLHSTKGDLHYAEVKALVIKGALTKTFKDGSRAYYNRSIPAVKFLPKQ